MTAVHDFCHYISSPLDLFSGLCLRLYPQSLYEEGMEEAHCPGVMEENLSHLVLLLKRLDIADMGQCKFLDRPGTLLNNSGKLENGFLLLFINYFLNV